jgi:hypothetical protein
MVRRCYYTNQNFLMYGAPATGKTFNIEAAVRELGAEVEATGKRFVYAYLNGGTLTPTDLVMAMPDPQSNGKLRYYFNAALPNAHDDPDMTGVLLIGETALLGMAASAPLQKVINHEEVGGYRLPDGIIVGMDGNLMSDRSNAQVLSRAFQSRANQVVVTLDREWMLEVYKRRYHPSISSFLKRNVAAMDNYDEVYDPKRARDADDDMTVEGKQGIWANLRSWSRVSRILDFASKEVAASGGAKALSDLVQPNMDLYGNVGKGVADTFMGHLTMISSLASIEEIFAAPKKAPVPDDPAGRFFLACTLAKIVSTKTFPAASIYMQRMGKEEQLVFLVSFIDRNPERRRDPEMVRIQAMDEYIDWAGDKAFNQSIIDAMRSTV